MLLWDEDALVAVHQTGWLGRACRQPVEGQGQLPSAYMTEYNLFGALAMEKNCQSPQLGMHRSCSNEGNMLRPRTVLVARIPADHSPRCRQWKCRGCTM